ncbi:hypothetical protein D1AOALGA4SA_9673 [Olavius algarvensis Delta 1 endosymbiont]|nr:hypothetical protein D1AOALGA4SA_9673 [Olavius algarvensis Delta 1 endosymbiont]
MVIAFVESKIYSKAYTKIRFPLPTNYHNYIGPKAQDL